MRTSVFVAAVAAVALAGVLVAGALAGGGPRAKPVHAVLTKSEGSIIVSLFDPADWGLRVMVTERGADGRERPDGPLTLDLPEGSRIVQARVAEWADGRPLLGLVVERPGKAGHSYHYAYRSPAPSHEPSTPRPAATQWLTSAPIFTSEGEAWRIVDVRCPGGDSLELTFRRGTVPTDAKSAPSFEERVYANGGPGRDPALGGTLWTLAAAR
jgi:hypothetical protein